LASIIVRKRIGAFGAGKIAESKVFLRPRDRVGIVIVVEANQVPFVDFAPVLILQPGELHDHVNILVLSAETEAPKPRIVVLSKVHIGHRSLELVLWTGMLPHSKLYFSLVHWNRIYFTTLHSPVFGLYLIVQFPASKSIGGQHEEAKSVPHVVPRIAEEEIKESILVAGRFPRTCIDNAENYHEAQAFNRLLIHDVRTVGQGIDEISNTISMNEVLRQNPHPDWADLPEPQNTREFFEEDACTEAERLLREAERLLQTAGAAPSQQKTLTDLRARLVKAQAITGPSAPPPGSTKAALQEYALKKGAVFFIIRDHALSVTEDTNKFLAALLPDAEAKRKRNDEIYRTLTFVTYGLFGLGWCVGVARVLTDDQDDDTDEL
jgi:hypothetical protein